MASTLLVRAVFGLLVAATAGAFFVTQRLKRADPVVERVYFHQYVSPNGDGRKDSVRLRFDLPEPDEVTVSIVDERGEEVRTLADDRSLRAGTTYLRWDGRSAGGARAPDGEYRLRVALRSEGRTLTTPRRLTVDTTPPRPRVAAVSPPTIVPGLRGERGRARIRYEGESDPAPRFDVYRTGLAGARRVASFRGPRFRQTAEWSGRTRKGRPAPGGTYVVAVTVQDRAGNAGSSPSRLPPTRGAVRPGAGVSVRYLTLSGPPEPVAAGAVAHFRVGPIARRFRWTLTRVGAGRPLARGRGAGRGLALRVPRRARTGVYLMRLRAAGRRAVVPLPVRGRGRGRVLVVLPWISWQGRNPVDDDRDGFPDTLDVAPAARLGRAFADGGLPPGFRAEVGPLLRFLDRVRLTYDLTTDLALARRTGPRVSGRPGVVFAGSARWLPEHLDVGLRDYVEAGGRVASFGTDAFRRRVTIERRRLSGPSAPELANVFGEQTRLSRIPPAPMVVFADARLALFDGTDGFVGLFQRFERSERLVAGARILAAAGREAEHPAFVAYRLRRGLVIRVGAPDWARSLAGAPELARVTRRVWTLLSR